MGKLGRTQVLLSATDLAANGISAGTIDALELNLGDSGDMVNNLMIKVATSASTDLSSFESPTWTEVYLQNTQLVNGVNRLNFTAPFTYDGTSNLILKITYRNAENGAPNVLLGDITGNNTVISTQTNDGYIDFDGDNDHLRLESDEIDFSNGFTFAGWVKWDALGNWSRVMDFGNGPNADNILIANEGTTNNLAFSVRKGSDENRIDADGSIDVGQWMHIALTIDANNNAKIYKNGNVVSTGTIALPINTVRTNQYFGRSNWGSDAYFDGSMNDISLWNTEISQSEIQNMMFSEVTASHPDYSNLISFISFDGYDSNSELAVIGNGNASAVESGNPMVLDVNTNLLTRDFTVSNNRPQITFYQGDYTSHLDSTIVTDSVLQEKTNVELFEVQGNTVVLADFISGWSSDSYSTTAPDGTVTTTAITSFDLSGTNSTLNYFGVPFEVVEPYEIGRFVTPYGINFDLGPNGFTYIYDVTDYQALLKGDVDLRAHNTQELIDVQFKFIVGTPPRDFIKMEKLWGGLGDYSYSNLDNDNNLSATNVDLDPNGGMWKLKTRITGHGHYGSVNCCEWDSKDHQILVDGTPRFDWEIWEETDCADNPNISQGGTWPYAREGWCPGDLVKDYDFDLTPYVTAGGTASIDYDIEDVPARDQAQGSGNYRIAMQMVTYGEPNFQNDAHLVDILNPNRYEKYSKFNPTCQSPRVIIQNTGANNLTSARIKVTINWTTFAYIDWTGDLGFLEKEIVTIPIEDLDFWGPTLSESKFYAWIENVNGIQGEDEYHQNSVKSVYFEPVERIDGRFVIWHKANNKGHENQLYLKDSEGNVIWSREQNISNQEYKDTFDLDPGCYSIEIYDTDHDGMGFWYSGQVEGETAGFLRVRLISGAIQEIFPTDFGRYHKYDFSVGFTLDAPEEVDPNTLFKIFPNPSDGNMTLQIEGFKGEKLDLEIYDLSGRLVYKENFGNNAMQYFSKDLDLSNLTPGQYLVKLNSEKSNGVKQIIIK